MELRKDNVVILANGKVGVVDEVFGNPLLVVFKTFTTPIGRWDKDGNHKNPAYNIVRVLDGQTLIGSNPNDNVYRGSFDQTQLATLWERQ